MQLRIKELREGRGWNQTVLAYHSGLSPSQISLIETGKRNPSATTLQGIADALGVEVGDLFPKATAPPSPDTLLSPEWAHRVAPNLFRVTIRDTSSAELRELGAALLDDFSRVRTRDELLEADSTPDVRRVRAFSLAGVVNEELVRRGEEQLRAYVLAFRRFENAMSNGVDEAIREGDQEHRAG